MHAEALQLSKSANDSVNLSKTLNFIGRYYNQLGDYDNGLKYYLDSYTLRQILKDTVGMAVTSNNIGLCYYRLKNFDLSEKYLLKAIVLDSMLRDELYLVGDYNNLGLTYKALKKIPQALKAHEKSLHLAQKAGDTDGISTALGNLAMDYIEISEFSKAENLLTQSMQIRRELKKPSKLVWGHLMYTEFYNASGRPNLALQHADSALLFNKQVQNIDLQRQLFENRSLSYKKLNNFKKALEEQTRADSLKSILNEETRLKSVAASEARLNLLEKEVEFNQERNRFQLLEVQHQVTKQWLIFASIVLMLAFTILYLLRSRAFERRRLQLEKDFNRKLIKSVEQERKRISGELHDSIGQSLLLIKNTVFLKDKNTENLQIVDNAIKEVRQISNALHPFEFEKLGLIKSLKNVVSKFQARSKIYFTENLFEPRGSIAKEKEIHLYRMIQECLNNVEKHSGTAACKVEMEEKDNHLIFMVTDNGIGFDLTENKEKLNSLGMKTLKERARLIDAQLSINSTYQKGTMVTIKI